MIRTLLDGLYPTRRPRCRSRDQAEVVARRWVDGGPATGGNGLLLPLYSTKSSAVQVQNQFALACLDDGHFGYVGRTKNARRADVRCARHWLRIRISTPTTTSAMLARSRASFSA
ncbi:MAG: hypothetical protein ACJ8F3_12295 [Xanthobacteraceae bacterium]